MVRKMLVEAPLTEWSLHLPPVLRTVSPKLHPADVLSVCKVKGYKTAPVELDLARALTQPEADWYVELGAQGSLRVNSATGVVGK